MRLGIDLDGSIADWNHGFMLEANSLSGKNVVLPPGGPTQWHFDREYFSEDEIKAFWNTAGKTYSFWRSLRPLHPHIGELNTVINNAAYDDQFFFISTRPKELQRASVEWIKEHLNYGQPWVAHTPHKGHMAYALQLDAMFDDKPENLINVSRFLGTKCKLFLIDQPWNRNFSDDHIIRVGGFQEGLDRMKGVKV
jgi:hypothetical protein